MKHLCKKVFFIILICINVILASSCDAPISNGSSGSTALHPTLIHTPSLKPTSLSAPPQTTMSTAPLTSPPSPTQTINPTMTENPYHYFFPVQPRRNVDYSEGTAAHGYPAIDLFAPIGWEYIAVTSGEIEFISYNDAWNPVIDDPTTRGGIAISFIGDDGFRYYGSHLSQIEDGIKVGQRVDAGQLLGYIGDSGNANGKVSHLHFGISRPTYPEDWKTRRGEIDPYPYLNAWDAGLNVSPVYSTSTQTPNPLISILLR